MARRVGIALSVATALLLTLTCVAQAESHVRIVRLSYTDGQVQMDRHAGQGLERAILNAPIVEGARIMTGSNGLAEVEFENQSALRIAGNTDLTFRRLVVNDAGNKVNEIQVAHGTVYIDTQKGDDIYRLIANDKSFLVRQHTEARLIADSGQVTLAVLKGDAQAEDQGQTVNVKKKETVTVAANDAKPTVTQGVDGISTDAWNSERQAYSNSYARNVNINSGPVNGYGLQDLNYYGSFFYAPGFGYAWQPYGLAGFGGWNPYMSGAWLFDPTMGYSFASAYPWGWLPYHYGSWAYMPNYGWAWLPGNGSAYRGSTIAQSFQPVPKIGRAPAGFANPTAPAAGAGTVVVGKLGNMPTYIPGGRVPPDFRSAMGPGVAQGHSMAVKPGGTFVSANSANRAASANAGLAPASSRFPGGHVFAPPSRTSAASAGWGGADEHGFGSMGAPTMGAPIGVGHAGTSTGAHGGTAGGHGGGTVGH